MYSICYSNYNKPRAHLCDATYYYYTRAPVLRSVLHACVGDVLRVVYYTRLG